MISRVFKLSFAVVLLSILSNSNAIAQTSSGEVWPITSVELHEDGASVTHSSSVTFSGNSTKLRVRGIASDINPNTISVDMPSGISLESLSYIEVESDSPVLAEFNNVEDSIAILSVQKKMYEALLNTLIEESQFLKANRKIGSSQEVLLVDDLIEMADFLRDRNQDLGLEILDVEIDIKNVDEEIAELKKRKQKLQSVGADVEGVVELEFTNVSGLTKSGDVVLEYLTSSASWQPEYKIYYEEGEVFVKRFASLSQSSGVAWAGVDLKLLSGRPSSSLAPNDFEDWVLVEEAPRASVYSSSASVIDVDRMSAGGNAKSKSFAGDARYTFDIDGAINVSGKGKQVTVNVDEFNLEGDIRYYAAPAVNPEAYSMVRCANWSGNKMMPGVTQIVANNAYLGSFYMVLPTPGDTLELSLGADPHVVCSRTQSDERCTTRKFSGKKEVVQTWNLTVENNHTDTVSVNLVDRLPRYNKKNSKVEIVVTTSEDGEVDMVGHEVSYNFDLAPLEKRTYTYVITITYPSTMSLKNL